MNQQLSIIDTKKAHDTPPATNPVGEKAGKFVLVLAEMEKNVVGNPNLSHDVISSPPKLADWDDA